jgi:hypothetical protein
LYRLNVNVLGAESTPVANLALPPATNGGGVLGRQLFITLNEQQEPVMVVAAQSKGLQKSNFHAPHHETHYMIA